MARITENPKVVGGAILLSLALGLYLYGPDYWRKVTAPPPKLVVPAPMAEQGSDDMKFYRLVPKKLPDKWKQSLEPSEKVVPLIFDEVPKDEGAKQAVLPELTAGWHLSAVYLSEEDRVAVISGRMIREGDILDPFLVESITEERVVFRHPLGMREMLVGQRVAMEEPKKTKVEQVKSVLQQVKSVFGGKAEDKKK